jgi:hypothetical protein
MAATLTVGEIAQRVGWPGDMRTLTERIRGWVRDRQIRPYNERGGTGRHLRFDPDAIVDVAVLCALADRGMIIGERDLTFALSVARAQHHKWSLRQQERGERVYLAIIMARLGDFETKSAAHAGKLDDPLMLKMTGAADVAILVNLSVLFARMRAARPKPVSRRRRKRAQQGEPAS